jgi:nitric oxide reductase subunit B
MGGIVGTGHHMYWVGEPWIWLSIGSMFSFIEVMPLLLMIVEAIENRRRMKAHKGFAHRVALTYIMGAGVWNFFGAGVLGGLINTPLMNYYEHGTFLTLAHAHTAMFGAFGLLGFGLVYFALRYFVGEETWSEKPAMWAFWLYNAGMLLWCPLSGRFALEPAPRGNQYCHRLGRTVPCHQGPVRHGLPSLSRRCHACVLSDDRRECCRT